MIKIYEGLREQKQIDGQTLRGGNFAGSIRKHGIRKGVGFNIEPPILWNNAHPKDY